MTGDLVGVWRLESFHDLDDGGGRREGPLGSHPTGLLFYGGGGQVSVHMMGTSPGAGQRYLSYAGTWRRDGKRVVHTISIAPQDDWLGSEQVRDLELDGDRLVLVGRGPSGAPQRRVLSWRRVSR